MVLMHATHTYILSKQYSTPSNWISHISRYLHNHYDVIQDKVYTIGAEVAVIAREIENRNIITKLVIMRRWKFSDEEARMFAGKLMQCVQNNLI